MPESTFSNSPRSRTLIIAVLAATALAGCGREGGNLTAATKAFDVENVESIEFSATGKWFQFGQAPAPSSAWPPYDVSSYTATVNYEQPAAHVQITRKQVVEAGRIRPAPVEQKPDQYVSGAIAWNVDASAVAQAQPAAIAERTSEIWSTPHGFLKAALANQAKSQAVGDGAKVSFSIAGQNYFGVINEANEVASVQTWIDNPILGDALLETTFSEYKDFGGVRFPTRIHRSLGGHPVLDLTVAGVSVNQTVPIEAPQGVSADAPAVNVTAEPLAAGVFYLKGGSHHSVAIEQQDHVVVVEAPQNEARSAAVIAKVKELIPGKSIKYLINTHHHFDHSGGLRTYVAEGAAIVTHALNQPYYEQVWAAPHSINPDRLSQVPNAKPQFVTFDDKHVLSDAKRTIEIHKIAGNGHHDGFALVYLPAEKILIEADAFTPVAADAPPPETPNPFSVNLYENIQRLKLDVGQIAALHGPRVVSLEDLRAAIGQLPKTST